MSESYGYIETYKIITFCEIICIEHKISLVNYL